jgi:hypothetical protein
LTRYRRTRSQSTVLVDYEAGSDTKWCRDDEPERDPVIDPAVAAQTTGRESRDSGDNQIDMRRRQAYASDRQFFH